MLYAILWILGYFVSGYFAHFFLVQLIAPRPWPVSYGWVQKNWWVKWMDSWSELDSFTSADGIIRNHVPYKNPILQKLQIPLQLLAWPIDLLLTLIFKFMP